MEKSRSRSPSSLKEVLNMKGVGAKAPKLMEKSRSRSPSSLKEVLNMKEVGEKAPRRMVKSRSRSRSSLNSLKEVPKAQGVGAKAPKLMEKSRSRSPSSLKEVLNMKVEEKPRQILKSRSNSRASLKNMRDTDSKESLELSDSMSTIEESSRSNSAPIMPYIPEENEAETTLTPEEASPESPPYLSEYARSLRKSMSRRRSIHADPVPLVNRPFRPYATPYLNERPTLKRKRSPSPVDETNANTVKRSRSYLGRLVGLFRSESNGDTNKDDDTSMGCAIM
ncbi:unnamed protein product [Ceutorhynchus assimilis]|uniref:Uncharacterized protein n=1 Tax=Ceutorhynchus assimilis TaxID=467358 RepID=A0A9P0DK96_9CUCU|nr:unnamed protein product [Ceutorhynchus assimilis]